MARIVARAPTAVHTRDTVRAQVNHRRPGDAQAGKPHAPALRDLIPPALPRAHRLRRVWWRAHRHPCQPATPLRANRAGLHRKPSETPKPSTRREIRAGTLSLLYRTPRTFTEEIAPRRPGNRPHPRQCVRLSVKLYTLDRKTAPETGAITAIKSLHSAKTAITLLFFTDQTITPIFCSWRLFRLQHSKRAHSRTSCDSVRAFGASSRAPASKVIRVVLYVFMARFSQKPPEIIARGILALSRPRFARKRQKRRGFFLE